MKPSIRLRRLVRFNRDQRGVSAVEFAFVAPLLITLYLGCVEVSDGVSADRKVTLTAAALANLSAQVTTITTTDMTNILDASSAIIAPYSSGNLAITVTCISIDANKNATVKWSATRNGVAKTPGNPYTFTSATAALNVASTQLILAEASYSYTPIIGNALTGTLTLKDQMFMSPRISAPTYNGTACI
jgi:Flp pilus assembly protein TadG